MASTHHEPFAGPYGDGDALHGDGTPNVNLQDLRHELTAIDADTPTVAWRCTSDSSFFRDFHDVRPKDLDRHGDLLPPEHTWIVGGALADRSFTHQRPSPDLTRDAFSERRAPEVVDRTESFGDTVFQVDPITEERHPVTQHIEGITLALGALLLIEPRLTPNPDPADSETGEAASGTDPTTCDALRQVRFGSPPLRGIWDRRPSMLHDGRARGLRDLLCTPGHAALLDGDRGYNERDGSVDTHGATSSLSPRDIADLITGLETL